MRFEALAQGQLCNHFPRTQALTTKLGLSKSLQKANASMFFPRCYDFTDRGQMLEFAKDFNRTGVLNVLKKHAAAFKKAHCEELRMLERRVKKYSKYTTGKIWIKRIKNVYKGMYGVVREKPLLVNTFVVKAVLAYAKKEMNNEIGKRKPNGDKSLEDTLLNISLYNFPYTDSDRESISVYFHAKV